MRFQQGTAVIHHGPGIVQVGTDWGRELTFTNLTSAQERWLLALGQAAQASPFLYSPLLEAPAAPAGSLDLQIALRQAGYFPSLPVRGPRIVFSGLEAPICDAIDMGLSTSALSTLSIDDPRPFGRDLIPALGSQWLGRTRSESAREYFTDRYPLLTTASAGIRDLLIVTCTRSLDHALFGHLLASEEWHLPVLLGERGVIVGPLVVPGVSACARCLDLHMSGRDPERARAALAASHNALPRLPIAAQARLTLVLGRFLSDFSEHWRLHGLSSQAPPPLQGQSIAILPDGSSISHRLEPHPDCGCVALSLE
ncbi:hypothetical protein [Schaalia sp. Marseille-Q2122]|uniref:hypothetical protein n=1 Tax=Schaalia sp. Marseille-Q2122 TaxID=2736604 RepID=UPI00158CFA73|nr:hypothetical protein [Schaalia sp. Marseille-Q2122]